MIPKKVREKVIKHVTGILRSEGLLGAGQSLKITLKIGSRHRILIKEYTGDSDAQILGRVLSRMKSRSDRLQEELAKAKIGLPKIRKWGSPPYLPGVGKRCFTEFAEALLKEGVECQFAHTFHALAKSRERENVMVIPEKIRDSEWERIFKSLESPTSLGNIQAIRSLLEKIRQAGNRPIYAREAVSNPKGSIDDRLPGLIASLLKQRWRLSGLPYRIQLDPFRDRVTKKINTERKVWLAVISKQ